MELPLTFPPGEDRKVISILDKMHCCVKCDKSIEAWGDARSLACLHVLCSSQCLKMSEEREDEQEPEADFEDLKDTDRQFKNFVCPKCCLITSGKTVQSWSQFGKKLFERVVKLPCQCCLRRNEADYWCFGCKEHICQMCKDDHPLFVRSANHEVIPFASSRVRDLNTPVVLCLIHNRDCFEYCVTCDKFICGEHECREGHREHERKLTDDALMKLKEKSAATSERLWDFLLRAETLMDKLQSKAETIGSPDATARIFNDLKVAFQEMLDFIARCELNERIRVKDTILTRMKKLKVKQQFVQLLKLQAIQYLGLVGDTATIYAQNLISNYKNLDFRISQLDDSIDLAFEENESSEDVSPTEIYEATAATTRFGNFLVNNSGGGAVDNVSAAVQAATAPTTPTKGRPRGRPPRAQKAAMIPEPSTSHGELDSHVPQVTKRPGRTTSPNKRESETSRKSTRITRTEVELKRSTRNKSGSKRPSLNDFVFEGTKTGRRRKSNLSGSDSESRVIEPGKSLTPPGGSSRKPHGSFRRGQSSSSNDDSGKPSRSRSTSNESKSPDPERGGTRRKSTGPSTSTGSTPKKRGRGRPKHNVEAGPPRLTPSYANPQPMKINESSNDPNEDYCAVCLDGGDELLICCDTCPKVFHPSCHKPALPDVPSDDWQCMNCTGAVDPDPAEGTAEVEVTTNSGEDSDIQEIEMVAEEPPVLDGIEVME